MSKIAIFKTEVAYPANRLFGVFGNSYFEFVSGFDTRISILTYNRKFL